MFKNTHMSQLSSTQSVWHKNLTQDDCKIYQYIKQKWCKRQGESEWE